MTYEEQGTGGMALGGSARIQSINSWRLGCHCNVFTVEVGGGISCGGSASLPDTRVYGTGGTALGGSALVDVPTQTLDQMLGWWLLQESQSPYVDLVWDQDGTTDIPPTQSDGIGCLYAQQFTGTESIRLPDRTTPQPLSVSLWVKMESRYEAKAFFSSGAFCFGHSYMNHLWAWLETDTGRHETFSTDRLDTDRWYHVACGWDGLNLRLFINGSHVGTTQTTGVPLSEVTSAIGGWEDGGHPECRLLDVRLYGEVLDRVWWKAEVANQCDPGFVYVGSEETVF